MISAGHSSYRKKVVVIGNGMVGHRFCEKLRERDKHNEFEIIVFGEEPRRAYDRVHLSEYFSGKSAEDLYLCGPAWYGEQNIDLQVDTKVVEINKFKKNIILESGAVCSYDFLVLATGSAPFVPPMTGTDLFGVF